MSNWSASTFQTETPEIYQLELTNNCQLKCPACIRDDPRVERPRGFMSVDLIKTIAKRDLEGSYFVELQMYGEPLLHPQFGEIVDILKGAGVKVGASTNGLLIRDNIQAISKLDFLTISVDSIDERIYARQRPPASLHDLLNNIDLVQHMAVSTKIDLQVIDFHNGRNELAHLQLLAHNMHWNVTCREVPDCFAMYGDRSTPDENRSSVCLNPWLSVSIQWDGDVVPCCFSAGKHLVYGNLNQDDLTHIWQKSEVRRTLMNRMRLEYNTHEMPCKLCYMRSPVLFHQSMIMHHIKGKAC